MNELVFWIILRKLFGDGKKLRKETIQSVYWLIKSKERKKHLLPSFCLVKEALFEINYGWKGEVKVCFLFHFLFHLFIYLCILFCNFFVVQLGVGFKRKKNSTRRKTKVKKKQHQHFVLNVKQDCGRTVKICLPRLNGNFLKLFSPSSQGNVLLFHCNLSKADKKKRKGEEENKDVNYSVSY